MILNLTQSQCRCLKSVVLPRLSAGENPGIWILHLLDSVQGFAGDPMQESIAIIQAGGDKYMDEDLSNRINRTDK